jgi:D-alanine-D-alanine ligase
MGDGIRLGALEHGAAHRKRLREILEATRVFKADEVEVALELFDESATSTSDDDAPYQFLGAFDDSGELMGYACYGATPGADRTFDLYWIAMHPQAQGLGGGTALLADVERRVAVHEARMIVVETSSRPEYDATRRFYRSRGYDAAARMSDFYAAGDDRLVFTKRFP